MMGLQPAASPADRQSNCRSARRLRLLLRAKYARHARRTLGPYMERWGYELPAEWEIGGTTRLERIEYQIYSFLASLYWRPQATRMKTVKAAVDESGNA